MPSFCSIFINKAFEFRKYLTERCFCYWMSSFSIHLYHFRVLICMFLFLLDCRVFLVRESNSIAGTHVLSLAHNHKVKHCQIHRIERHGQLYFTLDGGHTKFLDLIQLIDFYMVNESGLPTKLTNYIPRLVWCDSGIQWLWHTKEVWCDIIVLYL